VGGGVILVMAAQFLAKPTVPAVAGVAPRAGGAAQSANRNEAPVLLASSDAPALALAGEPPVVRELFRPLVTRPSKSGPAGLPGGRAPQLPSAGQKTPAPVPSATATTPSTPAAPAAPSGPSVNDLRMLGVVEGGDGAKVLLKNINTGESRYFAKGEEAFGFKVASFTDSQVSLEHNGQTSSLAMSSFVAIEGPGGASTASSSGFGAGGFGGGGFGRGGFGRGSNGFGGDNGGFGGFRRRDRNGDNDGGGRRGGDSSGGSSTPAASSGFNTAQLFSLPTWTERVKKLEEMKAQIPADQYARVHKFMSVRAATETKK
jgi:hypothetical protein